MAPLNDMLERWRCRRFRARLVDLADGMLGADERRRVEGHVEGCARCADEIEALQSVPALLRKTVAERDEAEWARQRREIMGLIRGEAAPRWTAPPALLRDPARRGIPPSAVFAAAMAAVIAIVGYARFQATFRPSIQLTGTAAPVPNDIAALETETVVALDEVVEVIAVPGPERLGVEDLSDEELAAVEEWFDTDLG
ncbi:MAG: anti-sigma factor family protein [Candidatus Binatia bacterium]